MFGDLLGNMQQQQEAMKEKLATILVEAEAGEGAIKVTATADKQIKNISINKEKLDWEDAEQVEDMLLIALNRALEKAEEKAASEAQNLINNMMPGGMGGLGNLFG